VRVPPSSVGKILYPKAEAAAKIDALKESGLKRMGGPLMLLTKEQEDMGTALAVEMAVQHKPLAPAEMQRWAALVAESNGTREGATDLRSWWLAFVGRVKSKHGIDLLCMKTQQLSKQRSGVIKSGMRAFEAMVATLIADEPELEGNGLISTGNWDELKLDLNKLLTDGTSVVPAGMPAQWEVDGERCEQITVLAGFMGFRDHAINPLGKPTSLGQVKAMIKAGELESFGEVAGYPKLPLGFWDGPDFCVLVTLIIFKGLTGADPAWLNLVSDKSRVMVACTESGYINTALKLEWYRRCKQLEHCPYGKRPTIPQADSHASNESVEMSAEMELDDRAFLVAPPGHSTHLTQQLDQTGGPIQHFKRIDRDLVRHGYRIGGKLSKARIVQAVAQAIPLSFTPAICSWSTRHVGWGQSEDGSLTYSPLSLPHIASRLVNDEVATHTVPSPVEETPMAAAVPTLVASSKATAVPSAALAAFRSGARDGAIGLEAGIETALSVLGRGPKEGDGFDNEEDMEETIEEEGSRRRRNALPNGRCVASTEFRAAKEAQGRSAGDAEAAEQLKLFKERRLTGRVLNESASAEAKLAAGAKVTQALKQSFVRARTGKPVTLKGADLDAKIAALRGKALALTLGEEPDGYAEWPIQQVEETEAAKEAALAIELTTAVLEPEPMAEEPEPAAQVWRRHWCSPWFRSVCLASAVCRSSRGAVDEREGRVG
jgi:hypothetical protein